METKDKKENEKEKEKELPRKEHIGHLPKPNRFYYEKLMVTEKKIDFNLPQVEHCTTMEEGKRIDCY